MNRRNWFQSAWAGLVLVTVLMSGVLPGGESSHPGGELDQWLSAVSYETIKPQPVSVAVQPKAMRWAEVCIRRGNHWTIVEIPAQNASIHQVQEHLVLVHGHKYSELSGLSKEQLLNLHDAHHEGRTYNQYAIPATPANGVDRLSYSSGGCPGGVCPTSTTRSGRQRGPLGRWLHGD